MRTANAVARMRRGVRRGDGPALGRRAAAVAAGATALAGLGLPLTGAAAQAAQPSRPAQPAGMASVTIPVTTLADSGPGSLRAALTSAEQNPAGTTATITFTVHGVIGLSSALPPVTTRVLINGRSAPGYHGTPVIEIDFRGHQGLIFGPGAAGSALLGIAAGHAAGNGVTLEASAILVNGDYLGLGRSGRPLPNAGSGIYVTRTSSHDVIGANRSGISGVVGNVISANHGNGIVLSGSSGDVVQANRIGTNPAGSAPMGNRGNGIVLVGGADHNEIGGREYVNKATGQANNPTGSKGTVTPVFVVPPQGNLISGNGADGVLIIARADYNSLNGNFIGTSASGDHAIGNRGDGVRIVAARGNSLTGCRFVNNPFVYYNVISGNGGNGLRVTNAVNTVVQGNFFGVGANNTTLLGNRRDGILVDGTSYDTTVGGVIPLGNVTAGNGANGIEVADRAAKFTTFNTFGGLLAFKGAAPNGRDGLLITSTGRGNLVRTNVFSGNHGNGIQLAGGATGVTVDPNIVGLTTNGRSRLGNGGDGLLIDGHAHGNVIGGSLRSVIPQNTFSGNAGYGIAITGYAWGNRVFGSFVGTAIFAMSGLGNRAGGVLIGGHAHHNLVGHFRRARANIISANGGDGVRLLRGTYRNFVVRNHIGVDRVGRPLPNAGRAVVDLGRHNVVRFNLIG